MSSCRELVVMVIQPGAALEKERCGGGVIAYRSCHVVHPHHRGRVDVGVSTSQPRTTAFEGVVCPLTDPF